MTITSRITVLQTMAVPLLRRPLCCLTLCWIGGILLASHAALPWAGWGWLTLGLLLLWLFLPAARLLPRGLALYLAVCCAAATVTAWQAHFTAPGTVAGLITGGVMIGGYPLAAPTYAVDALGYNGWRLPFRVTAQRYGDRWHPVSADVYLSGSETAPAPGRYYQILGKVLPVTPQQNPYDFSWQQYLAERGWRARLRAMTVMPLTRPAPRPLFSDWRTQLEARLERTMPPAYPQPYTQLLCSLVLGAHGEALPKEMVEQFRRAGTIHLMVVSGSQVALLGSILLLPLWLLPQGRARMSYPRLRGVLVAAAFPLLGVYVLLADRGPSIDRALLMVLLGGLSLFLACSPLARRRSFHADAATLLAAAVLVMLAARPVLLFSAGLQLSVLAVLGLIVITPVLQRLLQRVLGPLAVIVAATLGVQLATLPALVWHFGAVPLLAPLTNLLAVPLVVLLLPLGLLALCSASVAPLLAQGVNLLTAPLMQLLLNINALAARCPWAVWQYYTRSTLLIAAYAVLLAIVLTALSRWTDRLERTWQVPGGREPRVW